MAGCAVGTLQLSGFASNSICRRSLQVLGRARAKFSNRHQAPNFSSRMAARATFRANHNASAEPHAMISQKARPRQWLSKLSEAIRARLYALQAEDVHKTWHRELLGELENERLGVPEAQTEAAVALQRDQGAAHVQQSLHSGVAERGLGTPDLRIAGGLEAQDAHASQSEHLHLRIEAKRCQLAEQGARELQSQPARVLGRRRPSCHGLLGARWGALRRSRSRRGQLRPLGLDHQACSKESPLVASGRGVLLQNLMLSPLLLSRPVLRCCLAGPLARLRQLGGGFGGPQAGESALRPPSWVLPGVRGSRKSCARPAARPWLLSLRRPPPPPEQIRTGEAGGA